MNILSWEDYNQILLGKAVDKNSGKQGIPLFLHHYESHFNDTRLGTGRSVNMELRKHVNISLMDVELTGDITVPNEYNEPFVGLYLCANGRARIDFSTESLSGGQWCLYCAPPGRYLLQFYGTSEKKYQVIGTYFSSASFQQFLGNHYPKLPFAITQSIKNFIPYARSGNYPADLHDRILQLITCPFDKLHEKLKLEGLLYELISYVFENFNDDKQQIETRHVKAVNKVCKMISAKPFAPPTITELAQQTGMSASLLYKVFKTVYGISTSRFIIDNKLIAARALLEHEDISVNEVAFSSGYESVSSFSRAFKKKFGVRPGEIIRNRT